MAYREVRKKQDELRAQKRKEKIQINEEALESGNDFNDIKLNAYVVNLVGLGWINCDAKREANEAEKQLSFWDNDETQECVHLFYPRRLSFLSTRRNGEYYETIALPKDEEFVLFAYKVVDGKPFIHHERLGRDIRNVELNFQPAKFSEFVEIARSYRNMKEEDAYSSIWE